MQVSCDLCDATAKWRVYTCALSEAAVTAAGTTDISFSEQTGDASALACRAHKDQVIAAMYGNHGDCAAELLRPRSAANMKIRYQIYKIRRLART